MKPVLPTEFYITDRPGSIADVEAACDHSMDTRVHQQTGIPVALGLDVRNVARASDLLFGTGVGIISILDESMLANPTALRDQARLSIAAGASELSIAGLADGFEAISALKSAVGQSTALTVDVTTERGLVDLGAAEQALALGADFVAFRPHPTDPSAINDGLNLVELASELRLGGVKLGGNSQTDERPAAILRSNEWSMTPGNARLCLPVNLHA